MNGVWAVTDLRKWPSEREYMPLLRSLPDRAARVAINMALLTQLFTSPRLTRSVGREKTKGACLPKVGRVSNHRYNIETNPACPKPLPAKN